MYELIRRLQSEQHSVLTRVCLVLALVLAVSGDLGTGSGVVTITGG